MLGIYSNTAISCEWYDYNKLCVLVTKTTGYGSRAVIISTKPTHEFSYIPYRTTLSSTTIYVIYQLQNYSIWQLLSL